MTRQQLEHILRAAGAITGADEIIVVGSQAILAQFADAPAELLVSMEADVIVPDSSESTNLVDGSIGEMSPFHTTFGYYAHGVGVETVVLPRGWQGRLVPIRTALTGAVTGRCAEVHDMAIGKLVAGREKDLEYLEALLRHRLIDVAVLRERLGEVPIEAARMQVCRERLDRLVAGRS